MKNKIYFLIAVFTICSLSNVKAETDNLIKGEASEFWKINFYGGNKKGIGSFSVIENGKDIPCINIACLAKEVHGQAISSKIPVTPGGKLKFNFNAKSNKTKVTVQLRFISKDNKSTGKYVLHVKMKPNVWINAGKEKRISFFFGLDKSGKLSNKIRSSVKDPVDFIVPAETEFVRVYLFNSGEGATLFKDVLLINIEEKINSDK